MNLCKSEVFAVKKNFKGWQAARFSSERTRTQHVACMSYIGDTGLYWCPISLLSHIDVPIWPFRVHVSLWVCVCLYHQHVYIATSAALCTSSSSSSYTHSGWLPGNAFTAQWQKFFSSTHTILLQQSARCATQWGHILVWRCMSLLHRAIGWQLEPYTHTHQSPEPRQFYWFSRHIVQKLLIKSLFFFFFFSFLFERQIACALNTKNRLKGVRATLREFSEC